MIDFFYNFHDLKMKKFSKLKEIKLISDFNDVLSYFDEEDIEILKIKLIGLLEQKIDLNKTRDDDKIKLFLNDVEIKDENQIRMLIDDNPYY